MATDKTTKKLTVEGVPFEITQVRAVGAKYVVAVEGEAFGFASVFTLADARRAAIEYVATAQLQDAIDKLEAARAATLEAENAAAAANAAKFDDPLDLLFS